MDVFDRMLELSREGYFCAQIMLELALEMEGKEDADVIRAMGGLNSGIGDGSNICGALSGGACMISYFAGRGEKDEIEHPALSAMLIELVSWFNEYTAEYGGSCCRKILEGDERNKIQRCPVVIRAVFEKCMELLERNGVL